MNGTRAQRMAMRLALPCLLAVSVGCGGGAAGRADSAARFEGVQERGKAVMGVDQYTSTHVFEDLPDGGRIVLDRDAAGDSAAVITIRAHMRDIAQAFRDGDFAKPFAVHAQEVPGTKVMSERRAMLSYEAVDRPRGAEVRIKTADSLAVQAVHEFLAFQRMDHRAAGHEGMSGDHAAHTADPKAPGRGG